MAKIGANIKLTALGKVGSDEYGNYAINVLKKYGINVENIIKTSHFDTSYGELDLIAPSIIETAKNLQYR